MTIFHTLDALEVVHILVACGDIGRSSRIRPDHACLITHKVCLSNRNIGQIC